MLVYWNMISCCQQDCVVLLEPYWAYPLPTTRTWWNHWMSRPILTCRGTVCMCVLNFFQLYLVSHRYFSTFEPIDLTPDSIMQQTGVPMLYDSASNQRLPYLYICLDSAMWQTCWGVPPSFCVSSAATVTTRFHTASRTIGVLEAPLRTCSGTWVTAAGISLYEPCLYRMADTCMMHCSKLFQVQVFSGALCVHCLAGCSAGLESLQL